MFKRLDISKLGLVDKVHNLSTILSRKCYDFLSDIKAVKGKMKNLAQTNFDLGLMHLRSGNLYDAGLRFRIVAYLDPEFYQAYYQWGRALIQSKQIERAKDKLAQALEIKPDYPEAKYLLATLDKTSTIDVIPLPLIAEYFDYQAENYNQRYLGDLKYQGHDQLFDAVIASTGQGARKDVLDLGCGTGLCGRIFRQQRFANKLVGVDVSESMLDIARQLTIDGTAVYTTLVHKSVNDYLKETVEEFDVISAGLVFNYVGDLKESFESVQKVLKTGGVFAFSLEKDTAETGFHILPNLERFVHSKAYIQELIKQQGWEEISIDEVQLYEGCMGYQGVVRKAGAGKSE